MEKNWSKKSSSGPCGRGCPAMSTVPAGNGNWLLGLALQLPPSEVGIEDWWVSRFAFYSLSRSPRVG